MLRSVSPSGAPSERYRTPERPPGPFQGTPYVVPLQAATLPPVVPQHGGSRGVATLPVVSYDGTPDTLRRYR